MQTTANHREYKDDKLFDELDIKGKKFYLFKGSPHDYWDGYVDLAAHAHIVFKNKGSLVFPSLTEIVDFTYADEDNTGYLKEFLRKNKRIYTSTQLAILSGFSELSMRDEQLRDKLGYDSQLHTTLDIDEFGPETGKGFEIGSQPKSKPNPSIHVGAIVEFLFARKYSVVLQFLENLAPGSEKFLYLERFCPREKSSCFCIEKSDYNNRINIVHTTD